MPEETVPDIDMSAIGTGCATGCGAGCLQLLITGVLISSAGVHVVRNDPNSIPIDLQWLILLLGLAVHFLVGYVTARKAPHSKRLHAIIVGVLVLVLGIAAVVLNPGLGKPSALGILAFLLSIPLTWLGAEWAIFQQAEAGNEQGNKQNTRSAPNPLWADPQAIASKVREIIASQLGLDIDEYDGTIVDAQADDFVGTIAILRRCEKAFGIEIPDEDAEHLATEDQIIAYIQSKLAR